MPTDFDVYNPSYWRFDAVMQPRVREAYRRLLAEGWIDSARHLHPDKRIYTYWNDERAFRQNKGWRLDFLLVNKLLIERLLTFGIDTEYRGRIKPSDHAPAWIELSAHIGLSRPQRPA